MEKCLKLLRFLIIILLFQTCSKQLPEFRVLEKMDGFHIKKTYGGVTKFALRGEKMVRGQKIVLSFVTGSFYDDGAVSADFQADRAVFSEDGREMEASGNVFILDKKNNAKIYLEDIRWDNAKRIYFTNKKVRQVSPDGEIFGTGLTAAEDLGRIVIENPRVTAETKKSDQ
ncbi:MAG: LPS export ABC transporter periplasmic protein LptC [bacterium]